MKLLSSQDEELAPRTSHEVNHAGAYIITGATANKLPLFDSSAKLDLLETILLESLQDMGWEVQAWAVFPNHYHFVGLSPDEGLSRKRLAGKIHGKSAIELNKLDGEPGRKVWYRTWDTRLSFSNSYLASLAYVHNNPVKHGLVQEAREYKWCSARWLELKGDRSFIETVMSFKTDLVTVQDDF